MRREELSENGYAYQEMKRLSIQKAETLASIFRSRIGISLTEPISAKTLLRKLNITAMYRPLSEDSYGISCKSKSGKMFMMINSNSTRGRQHFTIAHELYHLFYDESPTPHMCGGIATGTEKDANMFASALLLPKEGLLSMVSPEEAMDKRISLPTVLRIEQMYEVSRINLLLRLKEIGLLTEKSLNEIRSIPVKESAREYGYDLALYEPGNEGVVISDFGEKARLLFEQGKISEGHYVELLNMISNGSKQN